ncbi:MAG TPA: hypothetical protein VG965_04180 [Patescibacteria group bacterium]|nr:hypothetical protein [Patescibacteria group bacterium]
MVAETTGYEASKEAGVHSLRQMGANLATELGPLFPDIPMQGQDHRYMVGVKMRTVGDASEMLTLSSDGQIRSVTTQISEVGGGWHTTSEPYKSGNYDVIEHTPRLLNAVYETVRKRAHQDSDSDRIHAAIGVLNKRKAVLTAAKNISLDAMEEDSYGPGATDYFVESHDKMTDDPEISTDISNMKKVIDAYDFRSDIVASASHDELTEAVLDFVEEVGINGHAINISGEVVYFPLSEGGNGSEASSGLALSSSGEVVEVGSRFQNSVPTIRTEDSLEKDELKNLTDGLLHAAVHRVYPQLVW